MSKAAQHLDQLRSWMHAQGWRVQDHQEHTWLAQFEGRDGLVCVPTGMGKTYAAYFGALALALDDSVGPKRGLRVLWVTPLRAMARDLEAALRRPHKQQP